MERNEEIIKREQELIFLWRKYLKVWEHDKFFGYNCNDVEEPMEDGTYGMVHFPFSFHSFCDKMNNDFVMITGELNSFGAFEQYTFKEVYGK